MINKIDNDTAFGVEILGEDLSEIFLYSKGKNIVYMDKVYPTKAILLRSKNGQISEEIEL